MMLNQTAYDPNQHTFLGSHPSTQGTQHVDLDSLDAHSDTSSPHSSRSSLYSQYSNFRPSPVSTTNFDTVTSAVPRRTHNFKLPPSTPSALDFGGSQTLNQVPDLMPSADSQWLLASQQHTPAPANRLGHQRASSLTSSLGSNGPASPYNATTTNPHIAVADSSADIFHDLGGGESNYSYQPSKSLMAENFYGLGPLNGSGTGNTQFGDGLPDLVAQQQVGTPKRTSDRGLLPAPELTTGPSARSLTASVASSMAGGDSPATPCFQETEDVRRRRNGEPPDYPPVPHGFLLDYDQGFDYECSHLSHAAAYNQVPKLDRTMTDIYSDELYSPNFTITSASPPQQVPAAVSPSSDVFAQRLQAANTRHLNANSPTSGKPRNQSPFRRGSPLAPTLNDFSSEALVNSAQQAGEKQKQEADAKAVAQQLARKACQQQQRQQQQQQRPQQQQGTPNTISPKDAMLEISESAGASNLPLFPPQESNNFDLNQLNKTMPQQSHTFPAPTPLSAQFNFNMPPSFRMPQSYPFVSQPKPQQQATPSASASTLSRVGSVETNGSNSSEGSVKRPARTNADGGTYTCTYHGCRQRFETPALLQKHKREGHRQVNVLSTARPTAPPSPGVPSSLVNTQSGPHRCDRINPSTGKPCTTIFSRPYDLTRHEDTIHNARKTKSRCHLCTEEKTFSRADALTRHYRVVHPDVDFPGKHRRRGGSAI